MTIMILEYNKYLNSKDFPIFVPIFKVLLDRVKAACALQACWRGLKVRKHSLIAKLAIQRRAAYSIQR